MPRLAKQVTKNAQRRGQVRKPRGKPTKKLSRHAQQATELGLVRSLKDNLFFSDELNKYHALALSAMASPVHHEGRSARTGDEVRKVTKHVFATSASVSEAMLALAAMQLEGHGPTERLHANTDKRRRCDACTKLWDMLTSSGMRHVLFFVSKAGQEASSNQQNPCEHLACDGASCHCKRVFSIKVKNTAQKWFQEPRCILQGAGESKTCVAGRELLSLMRAAEEDGVPKPLNAAEKLPGSMMMMMNSTSTNSTSTGTNSVAASHASPQSHAEEESCSYSVTSPATETHGTPHSPHSPHEAPQTHSLQTHSLHPARTAGSMGMAEYQGLLGGSCASVASLVSQQGDFNTSTSTSGFQSASSRSTETYASYASAGSAASMSVTEEPRFGMTALDELRFQRETAVETMPRIITTGDDPHTPVSSAPQEQEEGEESVPFLQPPPFFDFAGDSLVDQQQQQQQTQQPEMQEQPAAMMATVEADDLGDIFGSGGDFEAQSDMDSTTNWLTGMLGDYSLMSSLSGSVAQLGPRLLRTTSTRDVKHSRTASSTAVRHSMSNPHGPRLPRTRSSANVKSSPYRSHSPLAELYESVIKEKNTGSASKSRSSSPVTEQRKSSKSSWAKLGVGAMDNGLSLLFASPSNTSHGRHESQRSGLLSLGSSLFSKTFGPNRKSTAVPSSRRAKASSYMEAPTPFF